ncbi:cell division protein ZipA C-terminal FtsZ-binding domain-containing protein [Acinetobacter rathckeae]|uniref:cell division protein ZipA C-terminal FtsZ-binding domain-containing protein n=1 Tax=Acinetobacter rathckeae TaxID=2605272 RepID=UPI0018A2F58D|nr:cell division protein ZipA C-terminal FtsZ-binding domain-containing protein [Acinetobacter rathckeae]MBF7686810.1 cell division protein ZipA [Acinetobacter rathckeae]MBF7695658.1 cell division protein ZipA [Acinetobacter rathckeae]
MEQNTLIGIVIAVLIIIFALYLILRKPKADEPSLDGELQINAESNQPVLPRFVRQKLDAEPSEQKTDTDEKVLDPVQAEKEAPLVQEHTENTKEAETEVTSETKEPVLDDKASKQTQDVEYKLNPHMEKAQIQSFEDDSAILDQHLHEQQRVDDESALATAKEIIALNVYPTYQHVLSGEKALKALLKYGLRFGELSCFHRHEETDTPSSLMFSVLRITEEGPVGFDLESLSTEQIHGLAFFLALPHPHAQQGFDMMVSIAGLIARDVGGKVFDENNVELSPQMKEYLRHQVIDFK